MAIIDGTVVNVADQGGTLVVGGNDSSTYFVNLADLSAAPIPVMTGGEVRADKLAYDPIDQVILITNPMRSRRIFRSSLHFHQNAYRTGEDYLRWRLGEGTWTLGDCWD